MSPINIDFDPFAKKHISLWKQWIQKPHVKDVWFLEGYLTPDTILTNALNPNGYDYAFVITINNHPIGFIMCCDLFAYRTLCKEAKGLFAKEDPGTFCMDLFIADENYLDKGYGTLVVKTFVSYIFERFNAKRILIDPSIENKRAIRCYEKVGFTFVKEAFDGVAHGVVLEINKYEAPKILKENMLSIREFKQ